MQTQKARGIAALSKYSNLACLSARTITRSMDLPSFLEHPVFARPCPMRPRHGFVDSRICRTAPEVAAVWNEARAADPEAELILMRPIDAVSSVVLAGGRLAIGPGHDGATAGHDVRELRVIPMSWNPSILSAAGIPEDETAYLELVVGTIGVEYAPRVKTYAVQLRAGPALPASSDFVPCETVVTSVVTPHDDLPRWESDVAAFPPGTVVVAPGGSLASHAAIHCVINGVPYVTSYMPSVGETIYPASDAPKFTLDASAFMRGSATADAQLASSERKAACKLAIVTLHQWPALRDSDAAIASQLLGFACRTLARAGAAICAGEARHYSLKLRRQRPTKISRAGRIDKSLCGSLTAQRRALTMAGKAFECSGWKGGYGGKAWLECASSVDRLWRAQSGALVEADLVEALNRVVNVAHNNGALLNKLVDEDFFGVAANGPTHQLIHLMAELHTVLTDAPAVAAKSLPAGGKIKRPVTPLYDRMHVVEEDGGIKAQLWIADSNRPYVSHHVAAAAHLVAWVKTCAHASKSRHGTSSRGYVPITLAAPIKADSASVLAAVTAAMGGAS